MLIHDFRFAFRSLRRVPGFTVAVVLTLGLGIGANTAIFSVIRGVLLRPLPHKDGDRLVYLRQSTKQLRLNCVIMKDTSPPKSMSGRAPSRPKWLKIAGKTA